MFQEVLSCLLREPKSFRIGLSEKRAERHLNIQYISANLRFSYMMGVSDLILFMKMLKYRCFYGTYGAIVLGCFYTSANVKFSVCNNTLDPFRYVE